MSMRRRITPKDEAAEAGAESVFDRPKPFTEIPTPPAGLQRVVEVVFDDIGWEADYAALEADLRVEVLNPGAVETSLNVAEHNALAAHRLYCAAKIALVSYEAELEPVLGAMRSSATAELQREKDAGQRGKQITDADVRDRAATLYPDEWTAGNEQAARVRVTCEHLERLADLWKGRSYSLSAMIGRR